METIQLDATALSTLNVIAGTWIDCITGQLWLSQNGLDIVLERGQRYQTTGNDLVVIEALKESVFQVEANTPSTSSQVESNLSINIQQQALAH